MAYEESLRSITLNADATLAAYTGVPGQPGSASPNGGKQYHFVKVTGVHQVGLADTTIVGVVQNKPQVTGGAATVAIRGVSKVVSDAAITAGTLVKCSADGQAAATGAGPTVGIALTTTANAGELVSVLLKL
jgi:hypothetical protein